MVKYGVEHLPLKEIKNILIGYVQSILELRLTIKHPARHITPDMFDQLSLAEIDQLVQDNLVNATSKLSHILDKTLAVVEEFPRRKNITLSFDVTEINGVLDVRGECPACHTDVSILDALQWDEGNNRLGIICPNCAVEWWING